MPKALHYFQWREAQIKKLEAAEGNSERVVELKKYTRALVHQAKTIDRTDLEILHYMDHVIHVSPLKVLSALKRLVNAQEGFANLLDVRK